MKSHPAVNLIVPCHLLVAILSLITSCSIQSDNNLPDQDWQIIEATISYSGTAHEMPFETYTLDWWISDSEDVLFSREEEKTLGGLSSGSKISTSPIPFEPGIYYLDGYLDWDKSGGPNGYEPRIVRTTVEVDGYETEHVFAELEDRTNPSDPGWVEGTVSYSGTTTGMYPLYIIIQDFDYAVISEERFVPGVLFNIQTPRLFNSGRVPAGTYYRVMAYWDLDFSGGFSGGDPIGDRGGGIVISPGLPTVGIDIDM